MAKSRIAVVVLSGLFGLLTMLAALFFVSMKHLGEGVSAHDLRPLELEIKKIAVNSLLLIKQPQSSAVSAAEYDIKSLHDAPTLTNDEKLFNTWQAGMQLANAALKEKSGYWISSSADFSFVPPESRVDGWKHSYCLLRRGKIVLIMSAGPMAEASPACKDIQIREEELASMPKARLLESPSGYLILVLAQRSQS